MTRRRIAAGGPWAAVAGYSRAVAAGDRVFVAGTTAVMPDGAEPPADAYAQTRRCFQIVFEALAEAGARPEDVVRTRIFLTRSQDFDDVLRAHGELFGEIRPAATAVVVSSLIEPWALVEVEADAVIGSQVVG